MLHPDVAVYNVGGCLRIHGRIDPELFAEALRRVVTANDALRLVFEPGESLPLQHASEAGPGLVFHDVSDRDDPDGEALRFMEREMARPFEMYGRPLARFALLRAAPERHYWLAACHHVVVDGWSVALMARRVAAVYTALRAAAGQGHGENGGAPYLEHVRDDDAYVGSPAWNRAQEFWRGCFPTVPEPLFSTPAKDDALRSAVVAFPIERARYDRLHDVADGFGVSIFHLFAGVLAIALHRRYGADEVVFGTPILNRRGRFKETIGPFVGMMPLRLGVAPATPFADLVRQASQQLRQAYRHQRFPLSEIHRSLGLVGGENGLRQLFDVALSFEKHDYGAAFDGLPIDVLRLGSGATRQPLLFSVQEYADDEDVRVYLEHQLAVLDSPSAERLARDVRRLFDEILRDPGRDVGKLDPCDPAERHQMLVEWNDTAAETAASTLPKLFAAQVQRTPDADAVVCGDDRWSYGELAGKVHGLAARLRRLGVGPEVRVAVAAERTPEMVAALLGVLEAGGAYVPLDPGYPASRLAFMLEDAEVRVLITQGHLVERLPHPTTINLDETWPEDDGTRGSPFPENLAYLIYTSGSTGRPKGVAIAHRSAVALLAWAHRAFPPGAFDAVLAATSISFDLSVFELFAPLTCGGRVVLVPSALALAELPPEAGVTLVNTVPSALADVLGRAGLPASVRVVNLAGEPLLPSLVDAVHARRADVEVRDLYGPSEDTTYTTMARRRTGGRQTIGRPIAGTRLYLLARDGRPAALGASGEIFVAGAGLARGYLGRPALTAERFLPDPFGGPGERLYRTGDLARHFDDGRLEFLGRTDHQVKLRGFRIELGEVDAALARHPTVERAVSVVREVAGDPRLVAYMVGHGGAAPSQDELRAALRDELPAHMVPSIFVVLDELPTTPSGKVDRRALPPPVAVAADAYEAPATPTEEALAALFGEVLGVDKVGRHDDFFALGGHSLLATRVVSRVRRSFGVELSLTDIFAAPRVADLAARIDASAPAAELPPLAPVPREGTLPLSFAQQRLWFLHQLDPRNPEYHMPAAFLAHGDLDVAVLQRTLDEVVRRHEALRTHFAETGEEPVQAIEPPRSQELPVVNLGALPPSLREREEQRLITADAVRPFDLARGPLLRTTVLRRGDDEHVLLTNQHHVVSDGGSVGVLVREVGALYRAFAAGEPSPLPPLPVQYADFAVWQRGFLSGTLERQLDAWRTRLDGVPPLELPTDRPRPAMRSGRGRHVPIVLSGPLVQVLEERGRQSEATLFMTLLAAFQAWLARLSGRSDVAVGTPVAGRQVPEVEGLIGFFVNTLVLRTRWARQDSFSRLLVRTRETALAAFEHQDVPFEHLVETLKIDRDSSRTPLFQVMLALQTDAIEPLSLPGLELTPLATHSGTSKFDLTLFLAPAPEGSLVGSIEYATELFDETTVRRFARGFAVLAESAARRPGASLESLEALAPAERAQMLFEWSRAESVAPMAPAHEAFAAQAARTPQADAVFHQETRTSYADLEEASNRIAHHLRRLGVGTDVRVGLCIAPSPQLVAALLGVWKAGGAYVPIDPSYPPERLRYVLEDARVRVLLTQEGLRERLPAGDWQVVSLDADAARIASEDATPPRLPVTPSQLAYVIYTSGSTGRPKGVMISHGALTAYLSFCRQGYPLAEGDRVLCHSPIGFDLTITSLLPPLLAGAGVEMVSTEDGEGLLAAMASDGDYRLVKMTPAHLELLRHSWDAEAPRAGVRLAILGGEALHGESVTWLRQRFPDLKVINEYGPTETVVGCCAYEVPAGAVRSGSRAGGAQVERVPIGRPIAGAWLAALAGLRPVPAGVPGELHIGGPALARGYLGKPGPTAASFLPDPLSGTEGGRLYRTGDLVRWLGSGELDFLGRVDHQVKVRGFRVELGEIEALARSHESVSECVAAVHGERLVAFVVPSVPDGLVSFLRDHLPEPMVPSSFVALAEMPLTPNGKVDRAALLHLGIPAPASRAAHEAPATPTEEVLAAIFAELLESPKVGRHDDFFEMGGHSLLATRAVSRIRRTFGAEIRLRQIFDAPTVAALAAAVDRARSGAVSDEAIPRRDGDRRQAPLSPAQQRLWIAERIEPGTAAYNVAGGLELLGDLDTGALARGYAEIVRRHEILRTRYEPGADGHGRQVIEEEAGVLPLVDLTRLELRCALAESHRLGATEARRPFDLERTAPVRTVLVRRSGGEHLLLAAFHHILTDGWSQGVLFRELRTLYEAFREGQPSPLPELAVQYADFAVWQRRTLDAEALADEVERARRRLTGAPPLLELPTDRPRSRDPRGKVVVLRLPAPLTDALETLGRRHGATLFMTLLGAFQVLLGRVSGQDDVVVGFPDANRRRVEVEPLVGFFVNTLVARTRFGDDPAWPELLQRVRGEVLDATAGTELPFEKLVEELAPARLSSASPIFQAMLAFERASWDMNRLGNLECRLLPAPTGASKFDLTLSLQDDGGELTGTLTYRTALFDRTRIQRLARSFQTLLEAVAEEPELRLSALPLLPAAERHQLLAEWAYEPAPEVRPGLLDELVAAQVARTPDTAAVIGADGEELSYAELLAAADRLAARLRCAGAGPEEVVGVCLERSPELMVTLLGVLRSGAAYLPLRTDYPEARLARLLADAGARIVVGTESLRERLPEDVCLVVDGMDEMGGMDGGRSARHPEQAAYVIYTSGSTGAPKGVVVSHRAVSRRLLWEARAGVAVAERVLQSTPVSFDPSVREIFGTWMVGGTLILARPDGEREPAYLGRLIAEAGISRARFVPSMLAETLPELAGKESLRTVTCGGEPLPNELARRFFDALPDAVLENRYGPTETTVSVSRWRGAAPGVRVTLGRPIAGAGLLVLDRRLRTLPAGVPGELVIDGETLARGYLGRARETAERFVPHPYSARPGERLYRTGDRVRHTSGGAFELLGRLDFQLKVRGHRIEPGEVEAALLAHPGVEEAVAGAEGKPRRLLAWVTGKELPEAQELRTFLRRTLPEPLVPSAIAVLPELPRTAHGKVDRQALLRRALPDADLGGEHVAPRTATESFLAGIWGEVLSRDPARVSVTEDFFAAGGHSLLAIQLVSRIREKRGVELPLRRVFEEPTLAAIAGAVDAATPQDPAPSLVRRPRAGGIERAPLSFSQRRLWFLDYLTPGEPHYNVHAALHLRGTLYPAVLEGALAAVQARHEILRTTFAAEDGEPVQVIHPPEPGGTVLPYADLSGLDERRRGDEARRLAAREEARPFDLATGPLWRTVLLRLADDEHVLLLTQHHIVTDGWSLGVLMREVAAFHAAQTLPPLPVQYADFTLWQQERLAAGGGVLEAEVAWWRGALDGAPGVLELPTDRPRPRQQSLRGATVGLTLPAPLAGELEELARRQGVTLFMVLLAALDVLLHRVTGARDLLVGTPVAHRNHRQVEDLVGFFVNTLVLRARPRPALSFAELLAEVGEGTLSAYEHQELPFEKLVEELAPERDLSRSPLFQVMFAYQNAPLRLALADLELELVEVEPSSVPFDLLVTLREPSPRSHGAVRGALVYCRDLFDATTAHRLGRGFTRLLAAAVADPRRPISELPLLGPGERHQVLTEWNTSFDSATGLRPVHEEIARRAALQGSALAVAGGGDRMSYGELEERSTRLARWLRRRGVGTGVRVGLCLEGSPAYMVGLLAVLKAGGVYVPIDPNYPAERLSYLLRDAGISVLLTRDGQPVAGSSAAYVTAADGAAADGEETAALPAVVLDDPVYVIYTSGSTGVPKGSGLFHRGLANLVRWYVEEYGIDGDDRFLIASSVSFDLTQKNLLAPLVVGGEVHFPDAGPFDPEVLRRVMRDAAVTAVNCTPTALYTILEWGEDDRELGSLRLALLGGETISVERLLRRRGFEAVVVNMYGPTECTDISAAYALHPLRRFLGAPVPIGRPPSGVSLYVLDASSRLVPPGVSGDLWVGGRSVGMGYLNDPRRTAERFCPDGFAAAAGARIYQTGDRGRHLRDGTVEFLGRLDFQVKLRGFRIELGEIQNVLEQHPAVRAAVVLAREERLVAYVVGEAPAAELSEHLRRKLPEYMVPSAYVPLEAIPTSAHGKVDRKALERLAVPETAGGQVAPAFSTPVEEAVAALWAEVLPEASGIGPHDDFFALGGHSLLAVRLLARLRAVFGVELAVRDIFTAPTVAALAARLESGEAAAREEVPLVRVPRDRPLPLSYAQERLWFLAQLNPGSAAYNISVVLRIEGPLCPDALAKSLAALADRHEPLRTTFVSTADGPRQVVAAAGVTRLPRVDLTALPTAAAAGEHRVLARREARRPFDLEGETLLRTTLIALGDEEHVLIANQHHAISDGWSIGVFLRELGVFYRRCTADSAEALPELAAGYADYAVWQRRWLQGETLERHLDFWRRNLAGTSGVLELPTDRPRPAVQSERGALVSYALPAGLVADTTALARRFGVTLFMTLLAALDTVLLRLTGQRDLSVGSPVAGRRLLQTEGLIGLFINTLVLRNDLSGDPRFGELLHRVRETALGAYAHQDLPFEKLVEELQPQRDLSRSPFFQVFFILQNTPLPEIDLGGLRLRPLAGGTGTAKFELTLALQPNGEALAGEIEYNTDLFDRATVQRFGGHLRRLLRAAADAPESRLAELPLLAAAERHQLLTEWNDTAAARPRPLLCRIEARRAEDPDAVAVITGGGERLSRDELAARAERFAAELCAAGVGDGELVGVRVEEPLLQLVAVLAVLRAGGAYLPLDPAYPEARLAYMAEDSGVRFVIRQTAPGETALAVTGGAPAPRTGLPDPAGRRAGQLAYVIYTSGSTGRPKGVAISHGALDNFLEAMRHIVDAGDVFLAVTSLSFDISTLELFLPLLSGVPLVLADRAQAADGDSLRALIAREGVTVLQATPATWWLLLAAGWPEDEKLKVLCGGEALGEDLAAALYPRARELWNLYGPTETTVWSAVERLAAAGPVTLGRPLANTRLAVLDPAGRPVPLGAAGELLIGGYGVARGYLGRGALSAGRFLPDFLPGAAPGARLYRTGDRVRRLADGRLLFLGRLDHQVKVRGYRIELGEIDAALARHPSLERAVTVVREVDGAPQLVAYVVGRDGATPGRDELRAALGDELPSYMVPSLFVVLEALPLTPNGKVDRAALGRRALPQPVAVTASVYEAPTTPAEEALAAVFGEVLAVGKVGRHDDFFELGGHSLLATRVVSRVRATLGRELPLRALFEAPTVARLAERLGPAPPPADLPPFRRVERGGLLPLSFAQQRLWLLEQIQPGTATYNIAGGANLSGKLDHARLAGALRRLLERHESLRTSFDRDAAGEPVQRIETLGVLPFVHADLTGLPPGRTEDETRRLVAAEAGRPFDLRHAPLVRIALVGRSPDDHVLHLTLHHAIADGWSTRLLVRDLSELYDAGPATPPDRGTWQYADFAVWQRQVLRGELRDRQLAYWRRRLDGIPAGTELPMDRPRPAVRTYHGESRGAVLGADLTRRLTTLSHEQDVTLFMTLLAAFQVLLGRLSGQDDLAVGTPVAGRRLLETEGMVGLFLNTLVLRTDLAGDPPFTELLGRVRDTALGAYEHQDVPFEMLLDELSPRRDLARTPFFQVFFNMLNLPDETLRTPDLEIVPLPSPEAPSKFDLTLYLSERDAEVHLTAAYNADLFDAARIEEMLAQYEAVLTQVTEDPLRPIGTLSLLTDAAREHLPDPCRPLPDDWRGSVYELFARRAAEQPDRVAVVDPRVEWTYGDLALRSSAVARWLRKHDIRRGDPVAVYAHRSAPLVSALLGILQAGGAFVILDPGYPAERLAEIAGLVRPRAWVELVAAGPPAAELEAWIGGTACPRLRIADDDAIEESGKGAPVEVGPDDLAYVAFTSGSEGRPKGILGLHGALSHFLPWQAEHFDLRPEDRYSMLSGLAHDPLQRDVFTPLSLGATLVVPEARQLFTPGYLARWMRDERISVTHLTPAMAQLLTERPAGEPPVEAPSLRRAFLIGDVLTRRDVARLQSLAPRIAVVNLYGSTETQRALSYHEVRRAEAGVHQKQVLPLGRGMDGMQLLVLNAGGGLAGVGEIGEIHVRSPHLARGYLDDVELTRERFLGNPFRDGDAGDRLYRTGDLGRYLPDGSVVFAGRRDQQVQIHGFRVELGEIEAELVRLPAVREAVVLFVEAGAAVAAERGRRLVAYVVPEPDTSLPGEEGPARATALRNDLRRRLPAYMVPAGVVFLDRLPLTPNGKVDRRALAARRDALEPAADFRAPQTELEERIAKIVRTVLSLERVGVDDNFFDLGGNSLLLVQVHARLQEALGREIPALALFNHPTVRTLAEQLAEPAEAGRTAARPMETRTEKRLHGRQRLRQKLRMSKRPSTRE